MPWVNGKWEPESDSVESRVAGITAKESPLMRKAAADGLRAAGSRGMQNSSMGIGAAQGAVLSAATPIASQDAQQTYGKNVQRMQDDAKALEIASSAAVSAANNYTQGIGQTLVNDKIPAGTRAAAQADMANLYQTTLSKIRALYPNVSMNWG